MTYLDTRKIIASALVLSLLTSVIYAQDAKAQELSFINVDLQGGNNVSVIDGSSNTVLTSITVETFAGGVALNPATNLVYVANEFAGTISVIDGASNTVLTSIPVEANPISVAVNPATNLVYVVNQGSGTVSVIDGTPGSPTENTVIASIAVGFVPVDVVVNPTTSIVYVTDSGNNVSVIDVAAGSPTENTVIASIAVDSFVESVDVNPATNTVYVASTGGTLSVIDGATNTVVSTIPVGANPVGVAVNSFTNIIYATNENSNTISVIDGATNAVVTTIAIGNHPRGIAVNPTTNTVYAASSSGTLFVIDGSTNTVVADVAVSVVPRSVAVNPTTDTIYVTKALDPEDFPFGIECGDPDFVYMTIFQEGLLARINKNTQEVEEIINDPDGPILFDQGFYGIARDPTTGNLFTNEAVHGKAWRFDPSAQRETAWTRIPLIEQIIHPNVSYPVGYDVRPDFIAIEGGGNGVLEVTGLGTPVFANDDVWVGLTYIADFDEVAESQGLTDRTFSGVVRIDLDTEPPEVTRFNIVDIQRDPETGDFLRDPDTGQLHTTIASLNIDGIDPSFILIPDINDDKIYRFNTNSLQVVQTYILPEGSRPNHVDTDGDNIYVALNKNNFSGEVTESGPFSEIAQIVTDEDRNLLEIRTINTGAPNFLSGTFTVFVSDNNLLIWTDQSTHVGTVDLSTTPATPQDFQTTGDTDSNHFACIPKPGEAWFASRGSAKVGILPNSKFSVGGVKRPTSKGRGGSDAFARTGIAFGDPNASNYDDQPPTFGNVLTSSGSMIVSAQIFDNVAVKEAKLLMGKVAYPMKPHAGNPVWWDVVVPSSDITSSGEVSFTIVAKDFIGNSGEYNGSTEVSAGTGLRTSQPGGSFIITPLTSGKLEPYSIIATSLGPTRQEAQLKPQITIKNDGDEPLKNIRLTLSSELKGKFLLSDYAVKSIAPHSEYTISLILNGKPNVDVMNNPIPYNGRIIVSVDNKSPYVLELYGSIPNQSALIQSLFMKMVKNKADERYKTFEKPELRIEQDATYEVTLGSGEDMIRSASDELIIRNTGDNALKNLRIMTSSLSDHFIVEQKNIELLPPNSFMKVKLVSKMNDVVPRDIHGELLVVPENGAPVSIPIDIVRKVQEDKNAMYEVRTISGNEAISNTMDGMIIRNNSEESINNVRIILPQTLTRIFLSSEDSFKSIEPHSEKVIRLQMRGSSDSTVKQIMNDYVGDVIIVSSDGMKKIVPIDIVWKSIASEHFVIYARDNVDELTKATQVVNFLEHDYSEATEIFGNVSTKTTIYMTSSLDELSMLTDALAPSTFIYDQDVAFVWSNSEDVNMLALREFAYRTIVKEYASYWIKQKIMMDKGNWLIDGISNYVTASIVGERGMIKEYMDSFIEEPSSFEWYGAGGGTTNPSQYGATYTLFNFLVDKYGERIIDNILSSMDSAMVNHNRCASYEQCVLLKAVYDTNGLSMNDKRHPITFESIVEEWNNYVIEEYGIGTEG